MSDTSIRVSEETHELAEEIKQPDESFDDALRRALDEKDTHTWHPLPVIIGTVLENGEPGSRSACGKLLSILKDDGTVVLWEQVESTTDRDTAERWMEHEAMDDYIYDVNDEYWGRYKKLGIIEEPVFGWEDGMSEIPDSLWEGWR